MIHDFFERYDDRLMPIPMCGCLFWTGSSTPKGYGTLCFGGEYHLAHRRAFEAANGEGSADGLTIRHWCDCPPCCNPDHLIGGTPLDNTRDMIERGRAKHPRGEEAGRALLTDAAVLLMRDFKRDGVSALWLAKVFGVHRNTVYSAVSGQSWGHLQ